MIDLWNSKHEDKIELTVIPDEQVVTKLATAVQAGDVPDLMSFDLIFMPDFMKAGFLVDLTDLLKDDPNQAKVANAFKDLATYEGKLYGTGFLPDVSILLWNKGLFKQAGLDPEKPPTDPRRGLRIRQEDSRHRARHLRLLLLGQLRRLQHLHAGAEHVGFGRLSPAAKRRRQGPRRPRRQGNARPICTACGRKA